MQEWLLIGFIGGMYLLGKLIVFLVCFAVYIIIGCMVTVYLGKDEAMLRWMYKEKRRWYRQAIFYLWPVTLFIYWRK